MDISKSLNVIKSETCIELSGPLFKVHSHLITHLFDRLVRLHTVPFFANMSLTAENHRIPLSDGNHIPVLGLGTYANPKVVRRI